MGLPKTTGPRLTAEAFMAWYDQQPDGRRYELLDGAMYEMQGERVAHGRIKGRIFNVLGREIAKSALRCEAYVDGMAVNVDGESVFEPDVLVRCGPDLPDDATLIPDPVIVVEVNSPPTQRVDALDKLRRYFRNPSIIHYLIVSPAKRSVIHHQPPAGRADCDEPGQRNGRVAAGAAGGGGGFGGGVWRGVKEWRNDRH